MAFRIVRNDITKIKADAIVNTANPKPKYDSGTDTAIYLAAGAEELLEARKKIGRIEEGRVAVTPAFALDAKYIYHTVGPIWYGGQKGERDIVRSCYTNCLNKALELGIESIAFPLLATGNYGFPKAEALQIATSVFSSFLAENDLDITLVVFDNESFTLSGKIFAGIDQYIDENYVEEKTGEEYGDPHKGLLMAGLAGAGMGAGAIPGIPFAEGPDATESFGACANEEVEAEESFDACADEEAPVKDRDRREKNNRRLFLGNRRLASRDELFEMRLPQQDMLAGSKAEEVAREEAAALKTEAAAPVAPVAPSAPAAAAAVMPKQRSLDDVMKNISETWSESLLRMIDEKGLTDVEVYKRANVDRKLFSKIRSDKDYKPKKTTAVAFALALRLNVDESKDFIGRAGYAFSPSSKFDLIIEYFIENQVYDFMTINLALFEHDQPQIG